MAFAHDKDKPGTLDIRTGFGEEIYVKHGLLGNEETAARDRLGDQYVNKKGILGGEDKAVNVFGNRYVKHRGAFGLGGTTVQASSILGDKIYSKKGFLGLGPRQTTVDLSGVSSVAQQLIGKLHPHPAMMMAPDGTMVPPGAMPQGMMGAPPMVPLNQLDQAAGLGAGGAPVQAP
jgi:hypothetical protein